jgi:predicted transcriptional regulator
VIGADSPVEHAVELLAKKHSAVLVQDEHKTIGILTRYDVIEYLSR